MNRNLTAAFKVEGRTFLELPQPVVTMTNIKEGDLFKSFVAPDGKIVLDRMETDLP